MNAARLLLPLALALLLAPLLTGCGAPKNVVLLLPDPDGHVGVVEVKAPAGTQTLTQAGTATRMADAKSAPTQPALLPEAEKEQLFGPVLRALPQKPARFVLYFVTDSVQLTPESQALLPEVLRTARERDSKDVAVVGHASRLGDESLNIVLARKRAEHVRELLARSGVAAESMEVSSHGSANPLVASANPNEPKNRRVEVTVR